MKRRYKKPNNQIQNSVKERMEKLIEEADKNPDLKDRYALHIRRYATRFKVRPTNDIKRRICKSCLRLLIPGRNCRVRTREGKIIYYCHNCRHHMRIPFYKERSQRRKR
ncbi:MAG: hypothetical protein R6V53_01640 [Candidatus Woesearchaeota archaeon]